MTINNKKREFLRNHAIKNNLGGDTHKQTQRYYTDIEICSLIKKYISSDNKLKSLFNDKTYSNNKTWKDNVSRHLDEDSRLRFYFQLERETRGITKCKFCDTPLGLESFTLKPIGYSSIYCPKCIVERNWMKGINQKHKGRKISDSKRKFFQTEQGKHIAKTVGEKNSLKMKEYYQTEQGKKRREQSRINNSITMRKRIVNGSFIPPINNRWTHWDAIVIFEGKEYKFRSSWEACFFLSNPTLEYESFKIPYCDENGIERTYIGDFYDRKSDILYELKPESVFKVQQHKMNCVINYCVDNGVKFIWVNEYNILDFVEKSKIINENSIQWDKMIEKIPNAKD